MITEKNRGKGFFTLFSLLFSEDLSALLQTQRHFVVQLPESGAVTKSHARVSFTGKGYAWLRDSKHRKVGLLFG